MKYSLSQKAFSGTLVVMLSVIVYSVYNNQPVDYQGMSMFIGAIGAVYWGRSKTKSDKTTGA